MSFHGDLRDLNDKRGEPKPETAQRDADLDADLEQALSNFRLSVHAWSDAELSRPRTIAAASPRGAWRTATAWALGCVLVAGGLSGAVYERQHRRELALIAAQRAAAQQKLMAAQKAKEDEDLLAHVDSDVSRDVPAAMEPLAQLMQVDNTQ
jgi:hypothetical protein